MHQLHEQNHESDEKCLHPGPAPPVYSSMLRRAFSYTKNITPCFGTIDTISGKSPL